MPSVAKGQGFALHLLGGFDARSQGKSIPGFAYDKMRALLAYLAMEPERDHSREALAELLWPSVEPVTARGNLRRTLSDLRRVLAQSDELFSGGKTVVRLVGACDVDALRFARPPANCADTPACQRCDACLAEISQSVACYRGEFLAGLSLPDCPDFEDWLLLKRESLHRHALALLEHLCSHHEQRGQPAQAIPHARRLVELDPWQEAGHRHLIRLLALNGQQAAALAQYESCRAQLWKELGVHPDADTQALAQRIRQGELGAPAAATAVPPQRNRLGTPPTERRQVTVLYCEFPLADVNDPEEALVLLQAPQRRGVELIHAYGGHVVQSHGGSLLAYFGFPAAREDAARQAVAAAMALAAESAAVRCGVHTGLIVTSPGQGIPDVAGPASDVAIRLRRHAAGGQVVVSHTTQRLIDGYYHGQPLDDGAHLVTGATEATDRLSAAARLTPFVGRDAELAQLLEAWRQVRQGRSGAILLRGDPGIGKSRLLRELKRQLDPQAAGAVRECRCLPNHDATPFHPIIDLLHGLCGWLPGDDQPTRRSKLEQRLQRYPSLPADAADLLASLLCLPLADDSPVARMSPEEQRRRLIAVLGDILLALAAQRPVLMIVEDMHWADWSTQELIGELAKRAADRPVLFLISARPEFAAPEGWTDGRFAELQLPHLSAESTRAIARAIARQLPQALSDAQMQRVIALSDGVPLYIEELAQWLNGLGGAPESAVPLTLHDLLMARIDQLGDAMRTAQVAATIGREFDLSLLAAVLGADAPGAPRAAAPQVDALLRSGLALGEPSCSALQFKHALVQEAAYQSQPRQLRQHTHRQVALALEAAQSRSSPSPALVAHHFTEAGEIERAVPCWHQAGQAAARHSGYREAAQHYRKALDLLATLPATPEREQQELPLQLALGTTLNGLAGYCAADTLEAFQRAHALAADSASLGARFQSLYGLWSSAASQRSHRDAREQTARLIRIAEQSRLPEHLVMAHFANLSASFWDSTFVENRLRADRVLVLCRQADRLACIQRYGQDPQANTQAFLARSLWFEGYPEQAARTAADALAAAREFHFPHSLCFTLAFACQVHRCLRQPEQVALLGGELAALAEQHGLEVWRHAADGMTGWAAAVQGQAEGLERCARGLAGIRRTITMVEVSYAAILMDAYAQTGHHDALLAEIDGVLDTANRRADVYLVPELWRLKGEALLARHPEQAATAQALFRQSFARAGQTGGRSLMLRAATSLARLERTPAARDQLAKTLADFVEGAATADHQDARKLLASLSLTGEAPANVA